MPAAAADCCAALVSQRIDATRISDANLLAAARCLHDTPGVSAGMLSSAALRRCLELCGVPLTARTKRRHKLMDIATDCIKALP